MQKGKTKIKECLEAKHKEFNDGAFNFIDVYLDRLGNQNLIG